MQTISIPLQQLVPDPAQPRTAMSAAVLESLAESIRTRGQLLPLRVRPADGDGKHIIISGHRRFAALVKLGAATAECVIVEEASDEAAVLAEQLAENLLREDLNPLDEADGYRRYIALRNITAAKAAEELHVPAARISRALALLSLPEDVRNLVRAGRVPKETAYYLSRLPEGEEQQRLFVKAAAGELGRDEAARAVRNRQSPTTEETLGRVTCKLVGGRSLT
jgi:ParB family transcriptional regulator, chromosome partitioning protein